jgi:hypothetical protein
VFDVTPRWFVHRSSNAFLRSDQKIFDPGPVEQGASSWQGGALAKSLEPLPYIAMPRIAIPIVEVTAPDGQKSFWGVYSIPHSHAVAVVKAGLPAKYKVELSVRRLPPGTRFNGARPGDIFKLHYDATPIRRVRSASARPANLFGQLPGANMEDLEKIAAQLTAAVRKMPSGHRRQDVLREISRLRSRMHALLHSASKSDNPKRNSHSSDVDVE